MANTEIKSDPILINRHIAYVYDFLYDLTNYEGLMPPEVVSFKAERDKAQLNLKGLGEFEIKKSNCFTNEHITLKPSGKLPFEFYIRWSFLEQGEETIVVGSINAQLNFFMKMMAESKLKDFVLYQASKLKAHLESNIPPE